jgi:hypothetical protein
VAFATALSSTLPTGSLACLRRERKDRRGLPRCVLAADQVNHAASLASA